MQSRQKVLFVISSMRGGGAERIVCSILRAINRDVFDPTLILFDGVGDYLDLIPDDVKIIILNKRNRYDFFRIIFDLNKVINDWGPSVVISFLSYTNIVSVLAVLLSRVRPRLVLSERNNSAGALRQSLAGVLKYGLSKLTYFFADKVIVISHGIKDFLVRRFHLAEEKVVVIYNPIDIQMIESMSSMPLHEDHVMCYQSRPVIVAMGRLTKQKNFEVLIRSFALLRKKIPAHLLILGKGELKDCLVNLVSQLGVASYVDFLGFQKNPFTYLKKADLFVLSSSWEGFGNVIIEAMACRLPVISTECPFGPAEIIENGINGILVRVNDEHALCEAMFKVLSNEHLRERLIGNGIESLDRYRLEKIVRQYERVMLGCPECGYEFT